MANAASLFRLAFDDHQADYRLNLQFCCDHYRSVSEVCRRLAMNRQQFNRYLIGAAIPSRHNHKRISDFFGLEDGELFAKHATFAASFKRRADRRDPPAMSPRLLSLLQALSSPGTEQLSEYQGFYFKYFYTYIGGQRIKRELAHWHLDGDVLVSSVKQRDLGEDEREDVAFRFITYRGVVGQLGDRLIVVDHNRGTSREVSTMLLYPKGRNLGRLNGMILGVSHGPARAIAAARVVMDFLGTEIDIRAALSRLGTFDLDEPTVPKGVKRAVGNDILPDETMFLAR